MAAKLKLQGIEEGILVWYPWYNLTQLGDPWLV